MIEIEELAGLGTADVSVLTPKVISAAIEEVARGKRVFAQFFKENTDLMQAPAHEIQFPKKGTGISASWDVSPGGTVVASTFAYDATTIRVKKGGIRLEFTNESLMASQRDVLRDHIEEAGIVWAETIDQIALDTLLDLQYTVATAAATVGVSVVTSTFTPVIIVDSATGCTIDGVDYSGGTFYLAATLAIGATIGFRYSNRVKSSGNSIKAKSAQTLSAWDIFKSKAQVVGDNYHPDVIIMNDADLPGLLWDEKVSFLDASAYGGRDPLLNGEIGKIGGLRVVTTTRAPEGVGIVIDSARLGYEVIKRRLRGFREDKYEYDSVWYHLWGEENFGVVNDNCLSVIVNSKAGTYPGKNSA